MIRKFKGRKAFVIVLAIVLTIALIPTTSFAGTGQEQARIHLDQSIGGNGDTLIITSPQGTYESSIKGGGKNITVDMNTFENLFDFKGQSTLDVTYTNATTGATGTLTLKHQEGHATGTMDEPDNGLNNFRGTVTPTPTGNEPTGNEPTGNEPTGN
ncbi:MAG: hypothetical protein E7228_00880, partial [Clostridiales bacterium]|nr:hypothetical protein [Clostridiales bacterium]